MALGSRTDGVAPERGWTRLLVVAAVALAALSTARPESVAGELSYVAVTGGAAAAAWTAARRIAGPAGRPWRLVAIGLALSAAADLWWAVGYLSGSDPDVSVADIGWLGSYVALGLGVVLLLGGRIDGVREDLEGLIDMAVVLVVSLLVLWQISLGALVDDDSLSATTRLVWVSYPVLDVLLFAAVVRAVASHRTRSALGRAMAGGMMCWLAADLGYVIFDGTRWVSALLDAGWMLGAVLLAAAAWGAARPRPARSLVAPREQEARRMGAWRLALALAPVPLPALLEVLSTGHRGGHGLVVLMFGTIGLTVLAFMRALLLLRARDDADRRLLSRQRYYQALAANSSDAVLVLDGAGIITNESPQLARLLGRPDIDLHGRNAIAAISDLDADEAASIFQRARATPGRVFGTELRVKGADGVEPWLAVRVVNGLDDPDVHGIIVNFHEITLRKRAEAELTRRAFHDSLTGLANRALFRDRVEHALATRTDRSMAVVYLDLDGFKDVNDRLGHEAGDELLVKVGRRLLSAVRPADTVARLGGDEFAILLEHVEDPHGEAAAVAERILHEMAAPLSVSGHAMTVSASIGIAIGDVDCTATTLLRDADMAMYQVKGDGRASWMVFDPLIRVRTLERLQIEQDLAQAVDRGQMRVAYQPVVALGSGELVGFEALLRWEHPTLGDIAPDRFVPIAEATGTITDLGRWVLDVACQHLARWRRDHPAHPDLSMAVNASARQLASSDLLGDVAAALNGAGLPASSLVIEMTETSLIHDPVATARRLHQLHELGIRLAIDDFGTGFSSLSYLRQFPVDILKLDRSFVSTIASDGSVPALLHGLIELGHTLNLQLIAEGVETEAQLVALHRERCQLGQGYLFAAAMDTLEVVDLLERTEPQPLTAPSDENALRGRRTFPVG